MDYFRNCTIGSLSKQLFEQLQTDNVCNCANGVIAQIAQKLFFFCTLHKRSVHFIMHTEMHASCVQLRRGTNFFSQCQCPWYCVAPAQIVLQASCWKVSKRAFWVCVPYAVRTPALWYPNDQSLWFPLSPD